MRSGSLVWTFLWITVCLGVPCSPSSVANPASADTTANHVTRPSYGQIVSRLYDLRFLAEPPVDGERSGSWTSAVGEVARYDVATDSYQNWGEGNDGRGCVRKEGEDCVVAEVTGPGVIWRVWSASPRTGRLKYYIDGSTTPTLAMSFNDYFDAQKAPFNYPELTHILSRGYNSYVPIAFNKSIKIVLEKDWGIFYQFTYTRFPPGTVVPSFTGTFAARDRATLAEANEILRKRGVVDNGDPSTATISRDIVVPAGATVDLADLKGSRAITSFRVQPLDIGVRSDHADAVQMMRELALQVHWDNEAAPSIWSPLGDFFGTAPGLNPYRSIPMGLTSEGFYSRWYMPFSSRALVQVKNDGSKSRRLRIVLTHKPEPRAAGLLRFHAKWHRDSFVGRDADRYLTGDRWPDWPVLFADNVAGRFLGFHLHVWNPNPLGSKRASIPGGFGGLSTKQSDLLSAYIAGRAWWGEGDEKFFVDGEKFPSTFGTGSEDYFGYAFSAFHPETFDSAFQSQPLNNNNYGHISNVRFQVADNVPFKRSFEAVIEKYHPNAWPLLYATTAYWYQSPGVTDGYGRVSLPTRLGYFEDVARDTDIYEAEQMSVVRKDSGSVAFDAWYGQFSADHAIVWKNVAKVGDRLMLRLTAEKSGEFELLMNVGQIPGAGTYRIYLDGKILRPSIDVGSGVSLADAKIPTEKMFYEQSGYASKLKEISLGRHDLIKGEHILSVQALKPGVSGFTFLLDYIRLRVTASQAQ